MRNYWIYILTSKNNRMLYIGVTGNLNQRIFQHKQKIIDGFTKKYNINKLVYIEEFNDIYEAISREKCLKNWKREWKIRLIEKQNPNWLDLSKGL